MQFVQLLSSRREPENMKKGGLQTLEDNSRDLCPSTWTTKFDRITADLRLASCSFSARIYGLFSFLLRQSSSFVGVYENQRDQAPRRWIEEKKKKKKTKTNRSEHCHSFVFPELYGRRQFLFEEFSSVGNATRDRDARNLKFTN